MDHFSERTGIKGGAKSKVVPKGGAWIRPWGEGEGRRRRMWATKVIIA